MHRDEDVHALDFSMEWDSLGIMFHKQFLGVVYKFCFFCVPFVMDLF